MTDADIHKADLLDLERQADRLGIPFTLDTNLADLLAAIAVREGEIMGESRFGLVNGKWEIEGALPNDLTFVDGHFLASAGTGEPDCFGDMWDGASGGADECAKCVFSPVCREAMSKITFVAAQARLGAEATLPALAAACEVSEQSILVLMALGQGVSTQEAAPKRKKKAPQAPAPEVERDPFAAVEEDVNPTHAEGEPVAQAYDPTAPLAQSEPQPPVQEAIAEVAPERPVSLAVTATAEPKKKRGRPAKAKAAKSVLELVNPLALPPKTETALPGMGELPPKQETDLRAKPAKKKAGKASKAAMPFDEAVNKKLMEGEPAVTSNPLKAPPAQRAKAGVPEQKVKSAQHAKARAGARPGEKWGTHTWPSRWGRERKRSPLIRKAIPGTVLKVKRLGKMYQLKVGNGYYEMNGRKVPTLYAAAKLAMGNMNWSAARFWGLDKMYLAPKKAKRPVT